MGRSIRIHYHNRDAARKAIPGSYLTACPAYRDYWDDTLIFPDPTDMIGLALPDGMSGKQAHRMLVQAGVVKDHRIK